MLCFASYFPNQHSEAKNTSLSNIESIFYVEISDVTIAY